MRRMQSVALFMSLAIFGGCVALSNKLPGKPFDLPQTPLADARIEYDILGDVQATATRSVIFGIPSDRFESHDAPGVAVQGAGGLMQLFGLGRTLTKVEKAAAYEATQQIPNTDGLIAVRTTQFEKRNYLVYISYMATVKAKAIKIKKTN